MRCLIIVFLMLANSAFAQFKPDAGLVVPFTADAKISVSSGKNVQYINDGKANTFWESDNPLPDNYIKRDDLNLLSDDRNYFSSLNIDEATDKNFNTKVTVSEPLLTIKLKKPRYLYLFSIKFQTDYPVKIVFYDENENIAKQQELKPEDNFKLLKIELNSLIGKIEIISKKPYNIFEVAALNAKPEEYVIIDFNRSVPVGQIYARVLNDKDVEKIEIIGGDTLNKLHHLFNISPIAIPLIPYLIKPEIKVRYIKIVFTLPLKDYYKVKLWEFDVYDKYGKYGKPPAAKEAKFNYGESFGINTVWGWGYNVYSDLIPENKGPWKFNKVTSLARIYHRLDWDIKNPQQNAGYKKMEKEGTKANNWLNWDREYELWKKAGFKIDACIMFNNSLFPDTLWQDVYSESFKLGKQFSNHFIKKGLINLIEVGNEPWGYNPVVYKKILSGFIDGAKSISNSSILPCAVQAYDKYVEINNYIATYLDENTVKKINGLNTHIYNYIFDSLGNRTAINPEDPRAEVWSVANLKKYADENMQYKDIFVTEFGYDSKGGGEDCTHPVCISEHLQAIYGVRTALILYRLGVREFYWYYFANVAYNFFLHNRSGLTASSNSEFKEKESFKAFKVLYRELKNYKFEKVISETDLIYGYLFKNDKNERIIIAWRPTSKNHDERKWIKVSGDYKINDVIPVTADKELNYRQNEIYISGTPVIIKISR